MEACGPSDRIASPVDDMGTPVMGFGSWGLRRNSNASSRCTWFAPGLATHHVLPSRVTCWLPRMILPGRLARSKWWWKDDRLVVWGARQRASLPDFPVVLGYAGARPARECDSMERPLDSNRAANGVKYDSASTAPADSSARFAKSADSPHVMERLKMPNAIA